MTRKSHLSNHLARLSRRLVAILSCLVAGAAVAACAAAAPYNPDNLGAAQLGAVQQICQTVLGLSPAEGSTGGTLLLVKAHLAPGTTHFQGCVASLSDSLQTADSNQTAVQADRSCRAQGLTPGSGALALCVLRSMQTASGPNAASEPAAAALQPAVGDAQGAPHAAGAFFYASAHETAQREQLACASLGLEPPSAAFQRCVSGLQSTFFAIDNPIE